MNLLMISGSLPPESCGVGDYTYALSDELIKNNVDVDLIRLKDVSFRKLNKVRYKRIIHIQYPSRGYGKSLWPQFLAIFFKCVVVTLHEYSQTHILRRLSTIPFLIFADKIIVTNQFEKHALISIYSKLDKKIEIIPVSSAMIPQSYVLASRQREGIAFFGLMRKDKGLEEFIELTKLVRNSSHNMSIHIFSAVPSGGDEYSHLIKARGINLDIIWHINDSLTDVSRGLLKCKYAYLHYPDGVSERRSSFMAAISHGLIVLSNSGSMTVDRLRSSFIDVNTPFDAMEKIQHAESDAKFAQNIQESALNTYDDYSLKVVVKKHLQLYGSLIK